MTLTHCRFLREPDISRLPEAYPAPEFYLPTRDVIAAEIAREQKGQFNVIHPDSGLKADFYLAKRDELDGWAFRNVHQYTFENTVVRIAPPEYVIVRKLEFFREGGSDKHLRDIRAMLAISGEQINAGGTGRMDPPPPPIGAGMETSQGAVTDSSIVAIAGSERERAGSIALDQWRGLALILVLISHGFFFKERDNGIGRVGVNLFFFISGILVFRSLSRARAATDWERTRSYWRRRLRRLYPALLAYVLAMLPLAWLLQHRPNLPPDSDFGSYLKTMPLALVSDDKLLRERADGRWVICGASRVRCNFTCSRR